MAVRMREVLLRPWVCVYVPLALSLSCSPAQAECFYFSTDFRLKILLHYSYISAYDISILECIGVSIIVSAVFFVLLASFAV